MQHQEFEAPEELRDVIKCFWYNLRVSGPGMSSFEVMPDGYAEIIFHFGNVCYIQTDAGMQLMPSPFMMGLLNQPAVFYTQHTLEIIGIRCYPWTVFDLLGLSSGNSGVQSFEHAIAQLQEPLTAYLKSGKLEEAINAVKNYFLEAHASVAMDSMLFKAGQAMSKANGNMPVREVAAAAHATVRTLERNFKQSSGHTVKDVAGLMRFEQVRNRLWMEPAVKLAGLAYELGYTDQSHLSREFKRYSGTTPAAFARKARKGQRIITNDFVAFVQA